MNPNSKQVSVQIKYAEDGYPPENFQTITVIVQPLNYETVSSFLFTISFRMLIQVLLTFPDHMDFTSCRYANIAIRAIELV